MESISKLVTCLVIRDKYLLNVVFPTSFNFLSLNSARCLEDSLRKLISEKAGVEFEYAPGGFA